MGLFYTRTIQGPKLEKNKAQQQINYHDYYCSLSSTKQLGWVELNV